MSTVFSGRPARNVNGSLVFTIAHWIHFGERFHLIFGYLSVCLENLTKVNVSVDMKDNACQIIWGIWQKRGGYVTTFSVSLFRAWWSGGAVELPARSRRAHRDAG